MNEVAKKGIRVEKKQMLDLVQRLIKKQDYEGLYRASRRLCLLDQLERDSFDRHPRRMTYELRKKGSDEVLALIEEDGFLDVNVAARKILRKKKIPLREAEIVVITKITVPMNGPGLLPKSSFS